MKGIEADETTKSGKSANGIVSSKTTYSPVLTSTEETTVFLLIEPNCLKNEVSKFKSGVLSKIPL